MSRALARFGLALALHALAVRLWTADDRSIVTPYGGAVLGLGGLVLTVGRDGHEEPCFRAGPAGPPSVKCLSID